MNIKTPVSRKGHTVVDAEGTALFTQPFSDDPDPLRDVVMMLNYQHLLVDALILWDVLFSEKEARERLAEVVGKAEADAVLAKTMLAVNPQLWKMATERRASRKAEAKIAESARKAFPVLIALLSPDFFPALNALLGEEGVAKLDALVGAAAATEAEAEWEGKG